MPPFRSTDGRTYRPDGFAPTVIPAVRRLATAGVQFDTHYVNAPVCCPSRSSMWSGRQPHKIPHQQDQNPSILRLSTSKSSAYFELILAPFVLQDAGVV